MDTLKERLDKIRQTEGLLTGIFVNEEQWNANANSYYIRYIDRMEGLAEEKQKIITNEQERRRKILETLACINATEESMAILASAVIQFARQVLSFRFGRKLNLRNVRIIASQSIVEIIWEGRNHTMH
jgi:flagellar biosynthesis/type III secretory pathway chaperone